MPHFANKYIGRPWVAGAQGPDSFDCWGFVRYVLKHEYGHDVPQVYSLNSSLNGYRFINKRDISHL